MKRNYMSGTPINVYCTPDNVSGTPVNVSMVVKGGSYLQLLAYWYWEGECNFLLLLMFDVQSYSD